MNEKIPAEKKDDKMDELSPHSPLPDPNKDLVIFLCIIAVIVIPAFLALRSIHIPGKLIFPHGSAVVSDSVVANDVHKPMQKIYPPDCSPYGYTWSLSIFIAPILAILAWLQFSFKKKERSTKRLERVEKAFWLTIGILIPIGFILDLVFGNTFFDFPNKSANLGIYLPGYDFEKGAWIRDIPIEEFIFYAAGFMAILSVYIWCRENWFEASNWDKILGQHGLMPIYNISKIIAFRPIPGIIIGASLIAGAVLYKKFGPHDYHSGFPGYFTFLVAVAIMPAVFFFKIVHIYVNWKALSLTFFLLVQVSMMWEATLASPYGWWSYNYDQMMGLVIKPWSNLPIEAALLWLVVTFTTAIVYETVYIWLYSSKYKPKQASLKMD